MPRTADGSPSPPGRGQDEGKFTLSVPFSVLHSSFLIPQVRGNSLCRPLCRPLCRSRCPIPHSALGRGVIYFVPPPPKLRAKEGRSHSPFSVLRSPFSVLRSPFFIPQARGNLTLPKSALRTWTLHSSLRRKRSTEIAQFDACLRGPNPVRGGLFIEKTAE
jgi:hypothetical protein